MVVKAVPFSSETIPDVSVPRDSMSDHWYRKGAHHLSSRRLISESACFGFSRDLNCLVWFIVAWAGPQCSFFFWVFFLRADWSSSVFDSNCLKDSLGEKSNRESRDQVIEVNKGFSSEWSLFVQGLKGSRTRATCRLDWVEHKASFFCVLRSMGASHGIRMEKGFPELPETRGRPLSDLGRPGSAVPLCGAQQATDKAGVVLSPSHPPFLYSLLCNAVLCNFPREASLLFCMQVTSESWTVTVMLFPRSSVHSWLLITNFFQQQRRLHWALCLLCLSSEVLPLWYN